MIDNFANKFIDKMGPTDYSEAIEWIDGIRGLSNLEKKMLFEKLKNVMADLPDFLK